MFETVEKLDADVLYSILVDVSLHMIIITVVLP